MIGNIGIEQRAGCTSHAEQRADGTGAAACNREAPQAVLPVEFFDEL